MMVRVFNVIFATNDSLEYSTLPIKCDNEIDHNLENGRRQKIDMPILSDSCTLD